MKTESLTRRACSALGRILPIPVGRMIFRAAFTLLFIAPLSHLSAQQNCGSVTDPVTGCNVLYCDGNDCDDLVPADGVFTCNSCMPCGVESPPSDKYACARVELDLTGTTEYMNDPSLSGCSLPVTTQENGNFDFYLVNGSIDCGNPDFSIGDGGFLPLTVLSGGMAELIICKSGNAGRRDMNIMLTCCEPSAECNLSALDLEGCSIPAPFTDFNDVFTNVEACGGTLTMDYMDNGDLVICGDGDGADFTRTYTLYRDGVPFATCDQAITVEDNNGPVVNCMDFEDTFFDCPVGIGPNTPNGMWFEISPFGTIDVAAGGVYVTTIDVNNCVTDDCSSLGEIEYTLENSYQEDFVPGCSITIVNELRLRDECGNLSDNLITVRITIENNSTTPPTISCPADADLSCGADTSPDATGTATGSDDCGDVTITFNDEFTPDNCNQTGTGTGTGIITRTWTATNGCGITNTCEQTITIEDTTPPTIVCPPDATVECGISTSPDATGMATGSDNCGGVNITFSDSFDPACGNTGTITRTWTATDNCGLTTSCTQIIAIVDTTPPSIVCPPDARVECGMSTSPDATGMATGSDNCGSTTITFNDVFTPDNCNQTGTGTGTGMITRTWTATYECGLTSSCDQIITIEDTTPPTIVCPPDATVECGMSTSPDATGMATGSDNCGGVNITFSDSFDPACGNTGTITRTWTATDECGLTSSCDQIITIEDTTPPTIVCPPDATVECGMSTSPDATGMATRSDNCGGVNITFSDSFDPACGNTGTITRTWTATDECGLTSSCDQIITIEDTTPPTIVCPPDVTVECGMSTSPDATGMATGSDICGGVTTTFNDSFAPACGNTGTITRTWTATDDCGLTSSCTQTITVVDTTPPTISGPLPDGSTIEVECNLADPDWTAFEDMTDDLVIEDACSDTDDITVTYEDILLEEGICGVSDFLSIWQCTWTATDECGNSTTYTLIIRIVDTQGPEWTFFPADVGIECTDEVPFTQATATDACSEVDVSFVDEIIPGDCANNYTIRRRWTAVDGCGNETTDDQFITVSDNTPPTIALIDEYVNAYEDGQEVYVDCGDFSKITKLRHAARAFDACAGAVEVSFSYEDFGLFDCAEYGYIGHLVTTWTATDDCGNTSITTLYWFLTDTTPPVLHGVPADACVDELPAVPQVTAVDDCEFAVVSFSESAPIDCDGGQYVERTWTATDVCGNSSSATQRLTLGSSSGPSIAVNYPGLEGLPSGSTATIAATCESGGNVVTDLENAVEITGGCSANDATVSISLLDEGDCATTGYLARYALTVMARDICGNTSDYELFIEVEDMTPPVMSGPAEIVVSCGEAIPEISAVDACTAVASITFEDSEPIEPSCPDDLRNYERIWRATDACGNTSVFAQSITIVDDEGPELRNVPADACNDTTIGEPVTAFDLCQDTEVAVSFMESTDNLSGCGEVLTRTWTATDACGNTSVATQQVFFTDDQAPSLSFAHPLLTGLEDGGELILPVGFELGNPAEPYDFGDGAVTVEDNCAGNLQASVDIQVMPAEDCAEYGYIARVQYTWTATDPCGNEGKISLFVLYEDTYGPEIYGVPDNLVLYCEDPIPAPGEIWAKDNYDGYVEVSYSVESVDIDMGVRIIRSWRATDDCGNVTIETQHIDILDNTLTCAFELPEEVSCNSDGNLISVVVGGGTAPYTYYWEMVDCDGFITSDPTNATISYTIGYTTQNFVVTITDANGCVRVCTISVECEKDEEAFGLMMSSSNADESLAIYPNPATDQLRIKASALQETTVNLRIYSLLGQSMLEQTLTSWPAEGLLIDTKHYPAGTYIVRIEHEGAPPITKEIVVIR